MAKNGTIKASFKGYTYRMYWSATQSIANNESTVLIDHWLDCGLSWDLYTGPRSITAVVGSDSKTISSPSISTGGDSSTKLGTTKHVVKHNSDGSLTVTIKGTFGFNATIGGEYKGDIVASASVTLESIPRQATLTEWPETWTDEDNPTIKYSNPAGTAVTALEACISFDGSEDDIAYRSINKTEPLSYTFNLTDAERKILRQGTLSGSTKRKLKFYVRTTIGTTQYWSSNVSDLTIVNCKPTLSMSVKDTNEATTALTGDDQKIVRYASIVSVNSGAKALKEASITAQQISCGGKTINSGSGTFESVASGLFTFAVSDNRGQTVTDSKLMTLIEYIPLTCSQKIRVALDTVDETSAIANLTIHGNYFDGAFSSSNSNTLELYYRYKEKGVEWSTLPEDGWREVDGIIGIYNNGTYSVTIPIAGLDYSKQYVFQCMAYDRLGGITTDEYTARTKPVFDWGEEDFNFNVPVTFTGGITPINIPSGADLNAYTTPGLYVCALSTTAASLSNCPTDIAFMMEVLPNVPVTQRITEYKDDGPPGLFVRNYYDYKDVWGSWYPYSLRLTNIGTPVNLLSLTSYTFPSDGYLVLRASYRAGHYVNASLCGTIALTATSGAASNSQGNPTDTIFVRKGMFVNNITTNEGQQGNALQFYPLT